MASKNRAIATEAQVALAEFIGPVLAEVINNAPTLSNLFTTLQFNADDNPSIPLDLYYDVNAEDYIEVYSQSAAGGLPQNQVLPTVSEMKIHTYTLDSALSFEKQNLHSPCSRNPSEAREDFCKPVAWRSRQCSNQQQATRSTWQHRWSFPLGRFERIVHSR
jgi:hypothetical protein